MTSVAALTNLIVQILLLVALVLGSVIAKRRRFRTHCWIMRVITLVEVLTIAFLMAPAMGDFLGVWRGWTGFTTEIVIHHVLGVIAVLLFIYINLAYAGWVKSPRSLRPLMRVTLLVWVASLALGIHLYVYIWG